MSQAMKGDEVRPQRPGCVSAYAILLWAMSGLSLLALICMLTGAIAGVEGGFGLFELVVSGIGLVFLAIYVATGIGLWQMRKWGWALVVVIHSLSVIGGIVGFIGSFFILTEIAAGDVLIVICPNLLGLLVNGLILYWFITNRALFNGQTQYRPVIGPDGVETMEPAEKKGGDIGMILAAVVGLVLVAILVCVVVIALLAVLGPQIGNVFSQITFTLENPPEAALPLIR